MHYSNNETASEAQLQGSCPDLLLVAVGAHHLSNIMDYDKPLDRLHLAEEAEWAGCMKWVIRRGPGVHFPRRHHLVSLLPSYCRHLSERRR